MRNNFNTTLSEALLFVLMLGIFSTIKNLH